MNQLRQFLILHLIFNSHLKVDGGLLSERRHPLSYLMLSCNVKLARLLHLHRLSSLPNSSSSFDLEFGSPATPV
ncbi:hypothetical protein J6590_083794 [Homalodisca vitripennis]|nr:hypothetical protein J6590_083794 [Homalodisca vitripennis]